MTKILFFAGSARKDSVNKKLARAAYEYAMTQDGVEATFLDLAVYPMPIYDEDLETENGMPDNVKTIKQVLADHDGFFVASPEFNSSYPALLKNAIDWATRPAHKGEKPLLSFKGKAAALGATSPGALGGIRGLVPLRMLLGNIGVFVTPTQICVPGAFNAFDAHGGLIDDTLRALLESTVDELIDTARKL